MNRRAIIVLTGIIIVVGIVVALASTSGRGSGTPPPSACNFMVTMTVSNLTAASQTNLSPQTK